jgi:hypothetical protein
MKGPSPEDPSSESTPSPTAAGPASPDARRGLVRGGSERYYGLYRDRGTGDDERCAERSDVI